MRRREFFLGVYLTAVAAGELLTKISVPTRKPGTGDAMAGVTLGAHGTYIVNAAATVDAGGARSRSAASRRPVRATAMEERLAGGDFSEASRCRRRPRVSAPADASEKSPPARRSSIAVARTGVAATQPSATRAP